MLILANGLQKDNYWTERVKVATLIELTMQQNIATGSDKKCISSIE